MTVLLTNFERVDDAWLDEHPDTKIVGSPTTGVDHIDLEALGRRGVKFVSLQGERKFLNKITSTAEHSFGLILSLARDYPRAFRGKGWRPMGHKLAGKTLGIIGHRGRIGRQMARIAKGFGMKVIGIDQSLLLSLLGLGSAPRYSKALCNLLAKSDIVSVHIPLFGNEDFINYFHFSMMKPTAYFINTSRPGVVRKGHLLQALKDGKIAGAATDFADDKELDEFAGSFPSIIITDHIGGNTFEDRKETDEFIVKKMQKA